MRLDGVVAAFLAIITTEFGSASLKSDSTVGFRVLVENRVKFLHYLVLHFSLTALNLLQHGISFVQHLLLPLVGLHLVTNHVFILLNFGRLFIESGLERVDGKFARVRKTGVTV